MARVLIVVLMFFIYTSILLAADDWTQKFPSPRPSARSEHAMAYIGGDQVLLFGGSAGGTLLNDTWVYDLSENTWTQKNPGSAPSTRYQHAMAYIGGNKVLLFGGWDDTGIDNETWVYDLVTDTWTQKNPVSAPSGRYQHTMAYIGGDQVLLFGGSTGNKNDETWVYDLSANTWTQKTPPISPSARSNHAMAYIGGNQVLLFGGENGSMFDDTWVYDLSTNTWTQKSPGSAPSARVRHAMAYMGGDQALLFGGYDGARDNETWIYDLSANSWTQDLNTTQPSARWQHELSETSMDGTSYLVLFGGNDGADNDETWTFGGGDYSLPVELTSFTAHAGDSKVTLHWSTASEVNNEGFIILRSVSETGSFNEIDSYVSNNALNGAGNSSQSIQYTWVDNSVVNGNAYWYKLVDVDMNGVRTEHGPVSATPQAVDNDESSRTPVSFFLKNYPNPFNPSTTISFDLSSFPEQNIPVSLTIYDAGGARITVLYDGFLSAKAHSFKWNGLNSSGRMMPSGVYFYTLKSPLRTLTKKMMLLR